MGVRIILDVPGEDSESLYACDACESSDKVQALYKSKELLDTEGIKDREFCPACGSYTCTVCEGKETPYCKSCERASEDDFYR